MVGNQPVKVAKGIIAIGPVAVGGVAIGGLATAKEVAIGGVTTAKLMLYSQSYQLPNGLNQGSVYAFNQNYGGDFFAKFKEVYEDFGLIKQRLVQMFSRSF